MSRPTGAWTLLFRTIACNSGPTVPSEASGPQAGSVRGFLQASASFASILTLDTSNYCCIAQGTCFDPKIG
ncbi:hypothetical protein NDU88_002546 [Pleurodeles waltl]|uniref:Secreted protein n=1 Tax=Pleurodeles waltl TaxID=8319 RepID=A0AAV7MT49_PLEWA|nr:hypothetical protein NDU88_002546 [Pleurodeles waltl]